MSKVVYILGYNYDYESREILAVFTNKGKAEQIFESVQANGCRKDDGTYWLVSFVANDTSKVLKELK